MYAIIANGGKQYKVEEGKKLRIERVPGESGQAITFDQVLLVGGEQPKVGKPLVASATVNGEIIGEIKAEKVLIFKKKRRKGYEKKQGHRQKYTEVLITKINS